MSATVRDAKKTIGFLAPGASTPVPFPPRIGEINATATRALEGVSHRPDWSEPRLATPKNLVAYKAADGKYTLFSVNETGDVVPGNLKLFSDQTHSQGLISSDGKTHIASVTTKVAALTARKNESKQTYIQYDKTQIRQAGASFQINPTLSNGNARYDGGHGIDHQYSIGNSHYTKANYTPQHNDYNRVFKNYLVTRSSEFVEFPLYAQKSPQIKVKGDAVWDDVPLGILFIQINQQVISGTYYFPNGSFNYEPLKANGTANVVSAFKLHNTYLPLLKPAIISFQALEQREQEEQFSQTMADLTKAFALVDLSPDDDPLFQLILALFKDKKIEPSFLFQCNEDQDACMDQEALALPLKHLGSFLVEYAFINALKSETITVQSRLKIAKLMVKYYGCPEEIVDESHNPFFKRLKPLFEQIMGELTDWSLPYSAKDWIAIGTFLVKLAKKEPSTEAMYNLQENIVGDMARLLETVSPKITSSSCADLQLDYAQLVADIHEALANPEEDSACDVPLSDFVKAELMTSLEHAQDLLEELHVTDPESVEDRDNLIHDLKLYPLEYI